MHRTLRLLAALCWSGCWMAALLLAVGVLTIALYGGPPAAEVPRGFVWLAGQLDFGVLDRTSGLVQAPDPGAEVKDALANWGLAALAWLVLGWGISTMIAPPAAPSTAPSRDEDFRTAR